MMAKYILDKFRGRKSVASASVCSRRAKFIKDNSWIIRGLAADYKYTLMATYTLANF